VDGPVDGGRDGIVAGQEAGGDVMRCPTCGFDNLIGSDVCENCGGDIAGLDVPDGAQSFHGRLLGEHLEDLGPPPPITVSPEMTVEAAVAQMHATGSDCVLVLDGADLVGIFTDRDAVVKVADRPLGDLRIRDFMTPDPVVLRHDDPIAVAIHKMAVGGFRHIPIVEHGRPTGVVTARDRKSGV